MSVRFEVRNTQVIVGKIRIGDFANLNRVYEDSKNKKLMQRPSVCRLEFMYSYNLAYSGTTILYNKRLNLLKIKMQAPIIIT